MIAHIVVVQQMLHWEIVMESSVDYVCKREQSSCPWLLFDNIVKKLENWVKVLYFEKCTNEIKLYLFWWIFEIISFVQTFLLKPIKISPKLVIFFGM